MTKAERFEAALQAAINENPVTKTKRKDIAMTNPYRNHTLTQVCNLIADLPQTSDPHTQEAKWLAARELELTFAGWNQLRQDERNYRIGCHIEGTEATEQGIKRHLAVVDSKLPARSLMLFEKLAMDAGNWSGQPLYNGGARENGNLCDLKRKGFITTFEDRGDVFVIFTETGLELSYKLGHHTGPETLFDRLY